MKRKERGQRWLLRVLQSPIETAAASSAQWSSCVHNLLKGENNSCSSYEVLTLEFSPCVNDDTVYSSQQIAVLFGFFIPKWRSHCSPSEFALSSLSLWSGQNREENTRSPRQEKSSTKMTCARGFLGWQFQWYLSICQKSGQPTTIRVTLLFKMLTFPLVSSALVCLHKPSSRSLQSNV